MQVISENRISKSYATVAEKFSRMLTLISRWSDRRCARRAARFSRRWSSALSVPAYFLELLILIEDKRFPSHFGVDPIGICRAIQSNLRSTGFRQGASTLTQQLYNVRIAARPGKSYSRSVGAKLVQMTVGLWIGLRVSRLSILSEYLEAVYWGHDFRGLDAAAAGYFGRSRCDLSFEESFVLIERLACPNRVSYRRVHVMLKRSSIGDAIRANKSSAFRIGCLYEQLFEGTRVGTLSEQMSVSMGVSDFAGTTG